ncbi:MAG: class I SAM-dependent methyltransferase [Rhizobacter sp.]
MNVEQTSDALNDDVPVTVDFRRADHAQVWTATAMSARPWRADFFDVFAHAIAGAPLRRRCRVLELGSGPGFLAERLLAASDSIGYVGLDFSPAMHTLAQQRLGPMANRAQFLERDLRHPGWGDGLGPFDFVVTHQAVHELRHKRYAVALHAQARERLGPGGAYLVCDHFFGEGGMSNDRLYMTVDEQQQALRSAGFTQVTELLRKGGLTLHRAV